MEIVGRRLVNRVRSDRDIEAVAYRLALLLREARLKKKISKDALAWRCGLSAPGIRLIEQGKRMPTVYALMLLCKGLGLNPARMLQRAMTSLPVRKLPIKHPKGRSQIPQ